MILLLLSGSIIRSQILISPNYALKSPETIEIKEIEMNSKSAVFHMSIENRIVGGYFCSDKNTYIVYPDGKRSKLVASSGIPNCPASYKFKSIGEKLDFTLTFPPLKQGTGWIDLIEECSEGCISFYGVTLDNNLNKRIDAAFSLAESNEPARALESFIEIAVETDKENAGIEGMLYINIIKLARETGDLKKAEEWYNNFKLSGAPRLSEYLKYLNDQGIKY